MKRTLLALLLALPLAASAQAILRNAMTTNSPGRVPNTLATSANPIYPLLIEVPDGSGSDRPLKWSSNIFMLNTNLFVNGQALVNGGTSETNVANNYYTTNMFFISGKGNTLIVTQALTLTYLRTNLLSTDANGLVTTTKFGAGLTWDPVTQTISATATAGSGVSTAVTPLTYSGTNAVGFDCTTNNMSYTLLLTNHVLFGTSTFVGLPNKTTNMFFTLGLQQDSTGTWVPKFTNSIVKWASQNQPVIDTNANAVSYVYFHSSLFTNGTLVGSVNMPIQ